jgi:transcriptional regulator with XRE-family HTH domain
LPASQPNRKIYYIYKEITVDGAKIRKILAQNIKSFREHRLWSQAELAENSNISIPFLSEIERGNKWPYPDTLGRIAKALNVQAHELFWENSPSDKEREFTAMVVKELLSAQKAAADKISKQYLE